MRYLTLHDGPETGNYPICFLVPEINRTEIQKAYFTDREIPLDDVMIIDLHRNPDKKKTPAKEMKAYIEEELVSTLEGINVKYLVVADAGYFKTLTGAGKVEAHLGYLMDCKYGPWRVIYTPNYQGMFYNPDKIKTQIEQSMSALEAELNGSYAPPGTGIIEEAHYTTDPEEIEGWLEELVEFGSDYTVDIETFDLKHHKAGIGTITICWSSGKGLAFPVDAVAIPGAKSAPYIKRVHNERIREKLRWFFETNSSRLIYHSITFDVYVLIYQLFMKDILDTKGLLYGLRVMLKNVDCTKIITYLATNSCAGNDLSLKFNAQEFAGNYALEDIEDITAIPLDKLLEYNLVDGLCTWYVHDKNKPVMIADEQEVIYQTIFKPAFADIIQMQLTGAPLNMGRVIEVKEVLEAVEADAIDRFLQQPAVSEFVDVLREQHVEKRNAKLKTKQISIMDDESQAIEFNLNSGPQLQGLLYDFLDLPVIETTASGEPATDKDTLSSLRNHTGDAAVLSILSALADYKAVNKILGSFIPAFEQAAEGSDGWHYLFGNFNLGGTLSGRLSSSKPNMQNLPANVYMALRDHILAKYDNVLKGYVKKGSLALGKLIKSCFQAPPGWIFVGLDFDSLEDKISALTTKDPNKLKVYTDGYDGHSLRAYSYFLEDMPDIDPNSVASINSIADKYPNLRQDSKAPTFALTYQGTKNTLINKSGFSPEMAQQIFDRYHEMYSVSDAWVEEKLDQASKDGYVTVAFGLRVRTPLLKQVIRGTRKTPYAATAEGRSAGNACGQSWCLLNTRAGTSFMRAARQTAHKEAIRPCIQIHDAQYFLVQDSLQALEYVNSALPMAVSWQEHPEIQHDDVHLSGKLSIFYPTWAEEIELPNFANEEEISKIVQESLS